MGTADIEMDYSAMGQLANEVGQMQEDFETMCKNLDSLVESLSGQWQGKAQVEFAAAYSKLKPKLKTISGVLSNYSTEIKNASCSQMTTEAENKSLFDHVGIPSF